MSKLSIDVNVIDAGQSKTRNPQNKAKTSQTQSQGKLTVSDAKEQLASGGGKTPTPKAGPTSGATAFASGALVGVAAVKSVQKVANFASDYIGSTYSIRGADYQAMKLDHTMDQVNAGVDLATAAATGAGAGAVVGSIIFPGIGTAAGAAIGAAISTVTHISSTAWSMAKDNRDFLKEIQTSKIESQYYSQRVREDKTEKR